MLENKNVMKYHISPDGVVRPCKAHVEACRLGTHYDSEGEARQAYEQKMSKAAVPQAKSRKRLVRKTAALALVASFSLTGCSFEKITPETTSTSDPSATSQTPGSKNPFDRIFDEYKKGKDQPQADASSGQAVNVSDTIDKLNKLEVKGWAPETGYKSGMFPSSKGWEKAKQDTYKRDFTNIEYNSKGQVEKGTLNNPYTGETITYTRGHGSQVDVDHVVARKDAWRSGLQYQDKQVWEQFGTDPDNLLAVDSSSNRQKGDSNAASWLPPNKAYRCEYVSKQVNVKYKYKLSVRPAERDTMRNVLDSCKK